VERRREHAGQMIAVVLLSYRERYLSSPLFSGLMD
jgi:hypothetical protein